MLVNEGQIPIKAQPSPHHREAVRLFNSTDLRIELAALIRAGPFFLSVSVRPCRA